ncbi:hypothetical protein AALO_G00162650 [Alosa alosa]|uniref:Ig-like domain-containing protein n=1 Tax=Alosa alosa TaxID=278164 RepID=A0AAV6GB67_9TELE|nr:hypothetical protein AALO_G00162650 [Alosa alosa]
MRLLKSKRLKWFIMFLQTAEWHSGVVRLLPPLLRDQAWGVHTHQVFLLFCLAVGPSDVHIHWLVDGQRTQVLSVTEHRLIVTQGTVLLSSWVKETHLTKDSHYQCTATANTGNDTAEVHIRINRRDEDTDISRDMSEWRSALTDHEKLLQRWKKAWESCDGQGII